MLDLLSAFPDSDLSQTRSLRDGEALFRQGDAVKGPGQVISGGVALIRHTAAGTSVPLHRAGPGGTFAEASLFSETYHCDCVATEDTDLVLFDGSALRKRLASDRRTSLLLMRMLSAEVQRARRQIEIRTIRPAEERVFSAIADGWHTSSVVALAEDIGLTHEATYRALRRLVTDGRLWQTGRGRYELGE
ncbi:Crp/Fnr family transcriptional regulator [Halovulum sp. GXIMD14794]